MSDPTKTTSSNITLGNELQEYLEQESLGYNVYPGAERVDYDFTAERLNMYTMNLIVSTAHLIKGSLGVGFLSMHVGFMYGGLWTSLVATFIIGPVVSYCMLMLVRSAQKMYVRLRIPMLSYPELVEAVVATGPWKWLRKFRKTFRYIVDCCLFINMCGICCIYEIMIAITIKQALETISPAMKDLDLTLRSYLLLVTVPLILLCLIRNIKYLAPFSLASDIFIGICVLTTMYLGIFEASGIHERPAWKSIHGFYRFTGICLFSVDATGVVLAVENNMRKPKYFSIVLQYGNNLGQWANIIMEKKGGRVDWGNEGETITKPSRVAGTAIVLICLSITGFFGYWEWGEKCKGPITIHMPPTTFALMLQFVLAMMLCITFAAHFWVPFRLIWRYIVRIHKKKRGIWERFYRIIHIILITCMSVSFPNMIKLMIFFGDFFVALTAFIIPAFIESLVYWKEPHRGRRLIKNGILVFFGILLSGAAFYAVLDF